MQHAILAPSGHNSQPWIFRLDPAEQVLELRGDFSRCLPIVDRDGRELTMSCGAALLNLRLALQHLGVPYSVELMGNPECLARVSIQSGESQACEQAIFEAIATRRTHRMAFDPRPVEESLWAALRDAAQREGAALERVDADPIAHLIGEADLQLMVQPRYRTELAAWMRAGHTEPGSATVYDEFASSLAPLLVRFFNSGTLAAAHDQRMAREAPLLVVLTTPQDSCLDWLRAGQAMQRVLLTASAHGAQASYLNQPLALPETRSQLSCAGFPQLILRMGYQRQTLRKTPRRSLEEVLERQRVEVVE